MAAKNDNTSSVNMQNKIIAPMITSNVNLYILFQQSYLRIGLQDYKVYVASKAGDCKEDKH